MVAMTKSHIHQMTDVIAGVATGTLHTYAEQTAGASQVRCSAASAISIASTISAAAEFASSGRYAVCQQCIEIASWQSSRIHSSEGIHARSACNPSAGLLIANRLPSMKRRHHKDSNVLATEKKTASSKTITRSGFNNKINQNRHDSNPDRIQHWRTKC